MKKKITTPTKRKRQFNFEKLGADLLAHRMKNGVQYPDIMSKTGLTKNAVWRCEAGQEVGIAIVLPIIYDILGKTANDYVTFK